MKHGFIRLMKGPLESWTHFLLLNYLLVLEAVCLLLIYPLNLIDASESGVESMSRQVSHCFIYDISKLYKI